MGDDIIVDKAEQFSRLAPLMMALIVVVVVMGVSIKSAWMISIMINSKCNYAMGLTVVIAILTEFVVLPMI